MTSDSGPPGSAPETKYAYLRSDGTAYIVAGSAVAGIAAYAYQLLGGRTLGAEAFAPVSVLLTIHFLTFIVLLLPIEQLIVRRLTIDRTNAGIPARAYWLGGLTVVGATLFAWLGNDAYLNGDRRFILFTTLTVAGHFLYSAARGHLAGWRRFRAYGLSSGAASILRLAIAVAVTIVHPSASGFALGLVIGPAIVMLWRPFKPVAVHRRELDPRERESMTERGLLAGLVLAAAASQALLLGGPLIVGFLGGSAVEMSIAFAAFTLGRAPLTFGYNLLARVLPPFTEMAARGEREELRSWARGMAWAAVGLSVVAGLLGWFLGPWVIEAAFGSEFVPTSFAACVIAVGVVLAGAGLFVGQILVARNQPARLGIAWLSGVVAASAAVLLAMGLDAVSRVGLGFAVGEVIALIALVTGAVAVGEAAPYRRGTTAAYAMAKRTLDIGVSLLLGILTLPIVVLAAIAVRLDSPGPIFFRQVRLGRHLRPFGMLKIRSMRADADESVFAEHLAELQASRHSDTAATIRIEDDQRVTRVGHFIRKWSIDELPNLWNVLEGSMSLVGPRPLVGSEAELVGIESTRFKTRPGITGLAQVEGRDTISIEERTALDEEYVANQSMSLDLSILRRTVTTVFHGGGD
ncbi:MAG TPA: sugar transferase [Acidimicrobiia bacterium]|nr:sugar transferase [Acidimicrobiia bacterium]